MPGSVLPARRGSDHFRSVALLRHLSPVLVFAVLCFQSVTVEATEESRAGSGSIALSYQFQTADSLQSTQGEIYIGPVDSHTLNLQLTYFLTDRWTVVAGIPYVRRRYIGDLQHDPLKLDPPRPDVENVDQGDWNSAFQDFFAGLSYLAYNSRTFEVEPHLFVGIPSHGYPFFGNAAVGQNQKRLEIGSSFRYAPGLSDAYYGIDISYAFVEQVLGNNVNHWRINAEAGYFFTPRFAGRAFALVKEGNGLDFPDDFPSRTDENWYQHDRTVKHNYVIAGLGFDWAMSGDYHVSTSLMTMTHAYIIHVMDYAVDITLSRAF